MKNIAKFNYTELIKVFSYSKLVNIDSTNWKAIGVSTDSRTLEKDNLFVAILGERFDGHNSLEEAFLRGAAAAVVSQSWFDNNKKDVIKYPLIVVKNTVEALGELAKFHRNRFNIPIIAIAGSNGKTTTKDLIASILSTKYKVLKTYKSYNNQIGVPLMLLQLANDYDIAVLEIGTNTNGDIETLTEIIDPTDGLITNIGLEHLEMLIDIEGVEIEETFLFTYLNKKGRRCFVNMDDERLSKYDEILTNHYPFGIMNDTEHILKIEFDSALHPIISIYNNDTEESIIVRLNATGIAVAYNSIAAISVGLAFGLNTLEIVKGLSNYQPDTTNLYGRMIVETHKCMYILNDCYNANPSSMELALQTLHMFKYGDTKIAVLGDMNELGVNSNEEHIKTIKYALELANEVFVIGQNMQKAAFEITQENSNANLKVFGNYYEIASYFRMLNTNNAAKSNAILIKGSRNAEMERLVTMLKDI
ncbi:MAG: UDP-N-acetylmuramoyl-tripeptide--D-alanyl-D-alanine ligase [Bacteroidetes bacterium]|nr:UDP-N-acetylmuramoyl-tripeptide--D-alanyl-D-alanine ligase [Bacteroidota bacterium]